MILLFKHSEGVISVVDKELSWYEPVAYIINIKGAGLVLQSAPDTGHKTNFVYQLANLMLELGYNSSLMDEIGYYNDGE